MPPRLRQRHAPAGIFFGPLEKSEKVIARGPLSFRAYTPIWKTKNWPGCAEAVKAA
jgi:hypothetical protein